MNLTILQVRADDASRQRVLDKGKGKEVESAATPPTDDMKRISTNILNKFSKKSGEDGLESIRDPLRDTLYTYDYIKSAEEFRKLGSCAQVHALLLVEDHTLPAIRFVADVLHLMFKLSNNVSKRKHAHGGQEGQGAKARRLEECKV